MRGRLRLAAGLQAGLEHFARDRRRGVAAGAVFDQQHADDDARMQRGAKAANQASVLLASLSAPTQPLSSIPERPIRRIRCFRSRARVHWVFSSAVPVLPATVTPGIAAEVPVPLRTTPIISRRTVRATSALVTVAAGGSRRA